MASQQRLRDLESQLIGVALIPAANLAGLTLARLGDRY
jgi:hypothetical protein